MGKAALARKHAEDQIGRARTDKLYDAGLMVFYAEEYQHLTQRIADLERQSRQLLATLQGTAEQKSVAAQILQEAMVK